MWERRGRILLNVVSGEPGEGKCFLNMLFLIVVKEEFLKFLPRSSTCHFCSHFISPNQVHTVSNFIF